MDTITAPYLDPEIGSAELELRLSPLTEPELERVAAAWQSIVRQQTQKLVDATLAANGDGANVRERLAALSDQRRLLFEKFAIVLTAWQKKGGDADQIARYRAYRTAVLLDELRSSDTRALTDRAMRWARSRDGGIKWLINIAVALAALVGLGLIAGLTRRVARRGVGRMKKLSTLLQAFIGNVVYWLTIAFGLMLVLSSLGIDITPLLALAGGAGFILAFAMQETISNFFSGLMIMINKPFDEGDFIELEGVSTGTVRRTGVTSTTIVTPDNRIVHAPNNRVWNGIVTNVTSSGTRRVDMVFGIDYGDDVSKATAILEELVSKHPLVLETPEPVISVGELADSSVNILCRPWTKTSDYWVVYWEMQRLVKERFDREGISIPFPQRTLHIEREAADDSG